MPGERASASKAGGHVAHCWADQREHMEALYGWRSAEYQDCPGGTCLLPDGHDGPHAWTPDSEIAIRFAGGPDAE